MRRENQIGSLEESVKGDYPLNIPARGVAVKSAGKVKKTDKAMEIEAAYIKAAIKDEKVEYFCSRCNKVHKPSLKIWSKHLEFAGTSNVSETVLSTAKKIKEDVEKMIKAYEEEKEKEVLNELERTKREEFDENGYRWFYFEVVPHYGFRQIGNLGGYRSRAELEQERKFCFEQRVKRKDMRIVIVKAQIAEII
jgi:hypothetical protein